jgi:hypothetical protein
VVFSWGQFIIELPLPISAHLEAEPFLAITYPTVAIFVGN